MQKLSVILNSLGTNQIPGALNRLMEQRLPIKISYKLSKLVIKLQPELSAYEQARTALVKSLGAEDEKTQTFTVKPENLKEFTEELTKLQEQEIDLTFGEGKKFELLTLEDLAGVNISPQDMILLDWLIV